MAGGTTETHRDNHPLFTGTHKGANGAKILYDPGVEFRALGCDPDIGNYVENATQATGGRLTAATSATVSTGNAVFPVVLPIATAVEWNNGDTYNIYATSTKNQFISREWVDLSRGWRSSPESLQDGWHPEDIDLDDKGRKQVFGPGQPEPIGSI